MQSRIVSTVAVERVFRQAQLGLSLDLVMADRLRNAQAALEVSLRCVRVRDKYGDLPEVTFADRLAFREVQPPKHRQRFALAGFGAERVTGLEPGERQHRQRRRDVDLVAQLAVRSEER